MKHIDLGISIVLYCALLTQLKAAPAAPPAGDPEELRALRTAYETGLAPMKAKLEEAIKARKQSYVSSLDALAGQMTGSGKLDALAPLKVERDAF